MKKGSYDVALELPQWFFRIFIVILVLTILVAGIYVHISRDIQIDKFESQMIKYNIYSCLSYGTSRLEPGIIDRTKLPMFNSCIRSEDVILKMTLINEESKEEYFYPNENTFREKRPLCDIKLENFPYKCNTIKDYVILNDITDNPSSAFVEFDIILRNIT